MFIESENQGNKDCQLLVKINQDIKEDVSKEKKSKIKIFVSDKTKYGGVRKSSESLEDVTKSLKRPRNISPIYFKVILIVTHQK